MDLIDSGFDTAESLGYSPMKYLSFFGKFDPGPDALEKFDAKVVLHTRKHPAHSRLRYVQLLGRPGQIPVPSGRFKKEQSITAWQISS
ncbi:hypothetical protein RAC92_08150 [Agrobacterium sp. CR_3]